MTPLKTEVERVIAAGALGRSGTHIRLLQYLAEATEEGRVPKEIDIATDVLGRVDFDSVSDSTSRVYVHNLRQKLEAYYAGDGDGDASGTGPMLVIPKGKYQLLLEERNASSAGKNEAPKPAATRWLLLAGLALAALAFVAGRSTVPVAKEAGNPFGAAPVWSALLDDERAVTIVVGDYFIFSEGEHHRPGNRLIRDFSINSTQDLNNWLQEDPERQGKYLDIHLSYLPTGAAAALNELLAVLRPTTRSITVVPQSQFRPEQLRENHVIYVGYLSAMGQLAQFPFLASRLEIGKSFDELIDLETGIHYESSAGPVIEADISYEDFGYVSTFPGPAGNQFLYIAGMRDEGLMQVASTLRDPRVVNSLGGGFVSGGAPAFEALFQVSGIDRTYVTAKELFSAPVDASKIWMDTSRP